MSQKLRTGLQRPGAERRMMLQLHMWQTCLTLQEGASSLDTVSGYIYSCADINIEHLVTFDSAKKFAETFFMK